MCSGWFDMTVTDVFVYVLLCAWDVQLELLRMTSSLLKLGRV